MLCLSTAVAQYIKASTRRSGEGAGFLLREAERGGAVVSGSGPGQRALRGETHGSAVLSRRPG